MGREPFYCEMSEGDGIASDLVGWLNTEVSLPQRKLDIGYVPVLQVTDVDYSPRTRAQSALLPTPDSSQNLRPGSPGTCPTGGLWMTVFGVAR
ncbi:hypothetical protein NQZ68_026563 [Dissostichus eleginoides]|nr:hypothetical protein NQZ68_026563 [Dissostichus eleginoides]